MHAADAVLGSLDYERSEYEREGEPLMLFHIAATADTVVDLSAAMKTTLDEMKAEGVVTSACRCVDGSGYFFIAEAGDVDEVTAEIGRLSRLSDHPLAVSVTEVRPA